MMRSYLSRIGIAVAAASLLSMNAAAAATTWQIDPMHSSAQFAVRHLTISTVRGEFHKVTGTIVLDDTDIAKSTVEVSIDATTVDTREADRDKHLKSPDFFDVEKYPAINFKSTKVEQVAPGKLKVTGDLTIRGVTRPIVLGVEGPTAAIKDPWGNQRAAASGVTKINRQDFGVKWNAKMDNGGMVVGDEVSITVEIEMVRKDAARSGN